MSHQSLIYQLNGSTAQQWSDVNRALSCLSQSMRVWIVELEDHTYDLKRNAGSSNLITRQLASITRHQPEFARCNVTPYCIRAGVWRLFFLPDRVVLYQNNKPVSVAYSQMGVDIDVISFIEEEQPPSDAKVIGSTWKYVNKDGTPDLRFMDNCPLPVMEYSVAELNFAWGYSVRLHVSSVDAAQTFGDIMQMVSQNTPEGIQPQVTASEAPPHHRHAQHTPSTENAYALLGVSPQCSLEEASTAYKRLAKQYHPDMVSRFAPEFRTLAHEKMAAINQAYAEVKRLCALRVSFADTMPHRMNEETANDLVVLQVKRRLVGLEGVVAGKVHDLKSSQVVIGRDEGCSVRLVGDGMVSRRHACIVEKDGYHIVHDNVSTNGTFVNGVRVQMQALAPGDVVQFGSSKFRFE